MEALRAAFPETEPGDAAVVARVKAGDRDAYRLLVRRYQDVLYRHALRLTGEADTAAELVQASLVKGFTRLASCKEPDRFGGWLFRILANGCKDHLKSRRRRDVGLESVSAAPALVTRADPASELERGELRGQLEAALGRLNEQHRDAFVLKHVEGRSYEEIAGLLDVSVPALKMRVHRAREALRSALEEVV
jgi:RNA polymerase sigma-70 factor, ECF subfamily